jgi:hypothetical protein
MEETVAGFFRVRSHRCDYFEPEPLLLRVGEPPLPVEADGVPVVAFDPPPDVEAEEVLLASF